MINVMLLRLLTAVMCVFVCVCAWCVCVHGVYIGDATNDKRDALAAADGCNVCVCVCVCAWCVCVYLYGSIVGLLANVSFDRIHSFASFDRMHSSIECILLHSIK